MDASMLTALSLSLSLPYSPEQEEIEGHLLFTIVPAVNDKDSLSLSLSFFI